MQCEDQNNSEDFLQLLYLLHENISGVNGQFQDICFIMETMLRKWNSRVPWNSHKGLSGKDFRLLRK